MSGSKTQYAEGQVLGALLGGAPLVIPTTWFLAFSLADFDNAATGDNLSEPAGNGYGRVAVPNDDSAFSAITQDGSTNVTSLITLESPTANGGDWGVIKSAYLCDAANGGNTWMGSDLTPDGSGIQVSAGGSVAVSAGNFTASES